MADINNIIAFKIKKHLDERQISVTDFSKKADVGFNTIYRLLRGDPVFPNGKTLKKIASALRVNVSELLQDKAA